jgi:putative heme-binding domain-containing protein
MADPRLKIVPIDHDRSESYLGLAVDGMGRIFVGGREALYVYEPKLGGGYRSRRELYRFPPDTWLFNIAVRGHDLYVLTADALYVLPDGVVKREDLHPQKILWGMPNVSVHLGMHGMAFGPDGDIYVAMGDPVWYQANYGRPDHWTHWTFYHGPETNQTPYVGTGGVLRLSPDGRRLEVFSQGMRNDCGIAFDSSWNLFGSDNDHEQDYDNFAPGRLLYVAERSYFNWPRGWMTEKQPWRSDLLQTMTAKLGPCVPVGLCYYDDPFFPPEYRNCLYLARWDTRSIPRYPLRVEGDAYRTDEFPFLIAVGEGGTARPVSVTVGRGGRIFAICCHMEHNESTPHYQSDLFMITMSEDSKEAPFRAFDETEAPLDSLFEELDAPSFERRLRAHLELMRRGAPAFSEAVKRLATLNPASPAAVDLVWLAAADPGRSGLKKLVELTHNSVANVRLTAIRALARFGTDGEGPEVFLAALGDADARVRHGGLLSLFGQSGAPPVEEVAAAGAATLGQIIADGWLTNRFVSGGPSQMTSGMQPQWEDGSYIRQAAAFYLASKGGFKQLAALCDDADPRRRLMGVLALGFQLTIPAKNEVPSRWIPRSSVMADATNYFGPDCLEDRSVDRPYCEAAGMFSTQGIWLAVTMTQEQREAVLLLERRLQDSNENIARQALLFLRLIRKKDSDQEMALELGLVPQARSRRPLRNFRAATSTNLPPAFQKFDWAKEALKGDSGRGHELFVNRGCVRCHSVKTADGGSGGPSLAAAGSRFSASYLAESVMAPNAVVLPMFRWTAFGLKDGSEVDGLVVAESPEEVEVLMPSSLRQKILKEDITSRQIQNHSPMPEGLINTPDELRDLLAFLTSLK